MDATQWSEASASIWELTSGYSSKNRAKKLLIMLQIYIDDSASDSGDRRIFLAGYINTARQWILFSDAWQDELDANPRIEYFKMSEAKALRGQFRGMSGEQRDEKIKGFSRVIRHFKPASIHCSVSREQVERIIKPIAPYGMSNPYLFCFEGIMIPLAIHQAKLGETLPIDFIFDNQEGLGENARAVYRLARDMLPKKFDQFFLWTQFFVTIKKFCHCKLPTCLRGTYAENVRKAATTIFHQIICAQLGISMHVQR